MTTKEKTFLACIGSLFLFIFYIQWVEADVGDKSWIFFVTQKLYSGQKLYSEVLSVHLPLIFWLYLIPVSLSWWVGITDAHALIIVGSLMIAVSIWLCLNLIRSHPAFRDHKRKQREFVILLGLIFVVWSNPLYFLDREHLFFVLIFPYLLQYLPGIAGRKGSLAERTMIGVMAGIGFCIKPHCVLIFLAIQLMFFLQARSYRILWGVENAIIYSIASLYLAAIWVYAPDYINLVLPMSVATYSVISLGGGIFFFAVALILFAATFADFPWRANSPYSKDIRYLLGICAGFFLYSLANNGWAYAWNLLDCMILFITGWVWWQYQYLRAEHAADTKAIMKFRQGIFACACNMTVNIAAILILTVSSIAFTCEGACNLTQNLKEVVDKASARTFGAISINFSIWSNLDRESQAKWETRINSIWMLPKFFVSDKAFEQKYSWILKYVTQTYADDLNNNKPDLMFVDDTDMFYKIYYPVDLVAYLSRDATFKAAWSHYRYVKSLNYCDPRNLTSSENKPKKPNCKYDVYERIKPAGIHE